MKTVTIKTAEENPLDEIPSILPEIKDYVLKRAREHSGTFRYRINENYVEISRNRAAHLIENMSSNLVPLAHIYRDIFYIEFR